MAKVDILLPFILKWEGGFVNDPADAGGATNKGVTLATWRNVGYDKDGDDDIDVQDLKMLSNADVRDRVLKPHYWDRWQADRIRSQGLANILVDWVWNSGINGIKIPQRLLGLNPDGIVGPITLDTLNSVNPANFFQVVKEERIRFCRKICEQDPSQKIFLQGWINRINAIKYI